ncbi:MAG TPA: Omp28-related outer membrane protein [Ignavibacteria bacterium]
MNFKSPLVFLILSISVFLYSCESNDGMIVKGNPDAKATNKVLVELFTNTSCVPCVQANNFLNGVNNLSGVTNNDTNVIIMRVHTTLFAGDPYYNFNVPVNFARQQYYNAGLSNPRGFLMGTSMGSFNTSNWTNALNERLKTTNAFSINLSASYDSTEREAILNIQLNQLSGSSLPDFVMHAAVVENGLIMDPPAPNGEVDFENTLRDLVTPTGGEPFNITPGQTISFVKSFTLKSGIKAFNTDIIIFVQSVSTKEVFGVVKQKLVQ